MLQPYLDLWTQLYEIRLKWIYVSAKMFETVRIVNINSRKNSYKLPWKLRHLSSELTPMGLRMSQEKISGSVLSGLTILSRSSEILRKITRLN